MNEPLEETYFIWLYSQVASVRSKALHRTYWKLFRQMFTTEFVWFVPNDDNRVEDGRELRYQFVVDTEQPEPPAEWFQIGCSVLEMLIALSHRLSFQADGPVDAWFWHLLENLQLNGCNDATAPFEPRVDEILQRLIWRTYLPNGVGGLFPLRNAQKDQTKVEIWYQMSAYVIENF